MTTPVDLGLFGAFSFIFPVLLVYAIVLGVLMYSEMFKSAVVNNLIAILVALMMLFAPSLIEVVQFAIPWVALIIIFLVVMMMLAKFFGVSDDSIRAAWGQEGIVMWIIAAFIIVIIASVTKVYFGSGDFLEEGRSAVDSISEGKGEGEIRFWETLFHPNVLGFIIVMLIAMFTVTLITGRP